MTALSRLARPSRSLALLLVLALVALAAAPVLHAQQPNRPYLGVSLDPDASAPTIASVVSGSTAEEMGLQAGDVVVSWNGEATPSIQSLVSKVQSSAIGDEITLVIDRAGEEHTMTATLRAFVPPTAVGSPAPDFVIERWGNLAEGEEAPTVENLRGKVVLINCFQSWCPGCHSRGIPQTQEMLERFGDDERFVALHIQTVFEGHRRNSFEAGLRDLHNMGITDVPYGYDPGGASGRPDVMTKFFTRGTPWHILIDHDGTVIVSSFPQRSSDELAELIEQALAAAPETPGVAGEPDTTEPQEGDEPTDDEGVDY